MYFQAVVCLSLVILQVSGLPLTVNDRAEELSGNFEGDMVLSNEQRSIRNHNRNGLLNEKYRWPNNTVHYKIIPENFTSEQIDYIHKALNTIANVSCLTFVEAGPDATSYVRVVGDSIGCFSEVGFTGSIQDLNLAPNALEQGCFRLGTIIHEFLHALGFYHMQSASDRDDYVTIVWENIQRGAEHNFEKYASTEVSHFDTEYDYGSVLHYSATAFSLDFEPTIIPKDPNATIGQRKGMSEKDITKLNRMYKCDN
ncbi:zinc metalloproteinase nas-4-like [Wyeomyia smithii]|uniref:zinc metalloproteinase nas-4-like n=1 Tax=Wyeomyia smithii TaxID=174621 RepID=UPI002467F9BB|nr:zinc metalloproteinase nas-4-like [Wyeomyia smithii]